MRNRRWTQLWRPMWAVGLSVAVLVFGFATPVQADDLDNRRASAQAQLNATQAQQDELRDTLEDLDGQVAQAAAELLALQEQLPQLQAASDAAAATLQQAERESALIAARLDDARHQQDDLTAQLEQDDAQSELLREAIAQMGREAYRGGPDVSGLEVIMDSTSSQDFIDSYTQRSTALRLQSQALEELETLSAQNEAAQSRLDAVENKIVDLKAEAEQKVAAAAAAKRTADDAQAALDSLLAQVSAQQTSLDAQHSDIEAQLAAADAASAQLSAELAQMVSQQQTTSAPAQSVAVSGTVFSNPTSHNPMVVTSSYGMRMQPVLRIYRMHSGVDLRARCGEPIYATRAGTVQWSVFRSGYGNQIMVDHGWVNGSSLMSSYSHLSQMSVGRGQHVSAGQVVGYSGATGGISTGCHLHFETYVNGQTVNPASYLGL